MKQFQLKQQQSGFTLIELVVVIVVLGILAATALPKMADLQKDARAASLNGARAAVMSASNMAHAKFLAGGSKDIKFTYDGQEVDLSAGYPAEASIKGAAGLSTEFDTNETAPIKIYLKDATSTSSCYFSYKATTTTGTAAVVGDAVVTGC